MAGAAVPQFVPSKLDPKNRKRGSWRIRYVGSDSKRYSITRPTKLECAGAYAAEVRAMENGTWVPPKVRQARDKAAQKTTGEWVLEWLDLRKRSLKLTTFQDYEKTIRNRFLEAHGCAKVNKFSQIPLVQFTRGDAYAWWDAICEEWPSTAVTNRAAYIRLRSAFEDAVDRQMISFNPIQIKEASKKPKVAKKKDLPTLTQVFEVAAKITPQYKLAFLLTMLGGLRIGEALALRLNDLKNIGSEDDPVWVVSITKSLGRVHDAAGKIQMQEFEPKTESSIREVQLLGVLNRYVQDHLLKFSPETPDGYLFRTRTGKAVLYTSYNSCLARAKKAADIDVEFTSHSGRYLTTTLWAEGGATLKEIGALNGQSDPSVVLDHYLQQRPEHLERIRKHIDAEAAQSHENWRTADQKQK